MTVQLDWIVEKRVVKITVLQAYRRADLAQVNQFVMDGLLNNDNQTVYVVSDLSKVTTVLFSPSDIVHNFRFLKHERFSGGYGTGIPKSLRAVGNLMMIILRRTTGAKIQFVDSVEDAIAHIQQLEPDLDFSQFQQP
ncbi:MAG: hypothetical protein ACOYLB_09310 [Phototrophicaceae bacterium]